MLFTRFYELYLPCFQRVDNCREPVAKNRLLTSNQERQRGRGHIGREALMAECFYSLEGREEIPGLRFFGGAVATKKSSKKKDPAGKIADLLMAVEEKFGQDLKCSIGDYIRLLQAQQEFERETLQDIEVTWVESEEIKSDIGE